MDLSARVLGASVAEQLTKRLTAPLLTIGKDRFGRRDLAKVDCFNFTAAANLSAILNRELEVKDTKFVFEHVPPSALAVPRLGAISLAVLGACFIAKGLGGAHPLETWVRRHAKTPDDDDASLVSFLAIKKRHAVEVAAEHDAEVSRKRSRRNQAHRTRVERFTERQGATT